MNKHLLVSGLVAMALSPAMAAAQIQPAAPGRGADADAVASDPWIGAPMGIQAREAWLEHQIDTAMTNDEMDVEQGHSALQEIRDIRKADAAARAAGGLNDEQRAQLEARLDAVHAKVAKAISYNAVKSY